MIVMISHNVGVILTIADDGTWAIFTAFTIAYLNSFHHFYCGSRKLIVNNNDVTGISVGRDDVIGVHRPPNDVWIIDSSS